MLHFVEKQELYSHLGNQDVKANRSQGAPPSQVPAGASLHTETLPSE